MWKWLRSWFVWRFSLTRLVVAVLFLGVFVGLNLRGPKFHGGYGVNTVWGWPLPVAMLTFQCDPSPEPDSVKEQTGYEWIPWTHQTYHLFRLDSLRWLHSGWASFDWYMGDDLYIIYIVAAVANILLALTVLALILFLQIPRRKVAVKVE